MNPILLLFGLVSLTAWACSDTGKASDNAPPQTTNAGNSGAPPPDEDTADAGIPAPQAITLEILREIFQNGARPLSRRDAVEILKSAPYYIPKTNAYRALAPARRFAVHLRKDENGSLHFMP